MATHILEFLVKISALARIKKCKPLFCVGEDTVVAKGCRVFRLVEGRFEKIFEFPSSILSRFLDLFSLLFRLRRSGVYSAINYGGDYYFSYKKCLYAYSKTIGLKKIFSFCKGNGPLRFEKIENILGFSDCLVYGDYYGNKSKLEINIYRLKCGDDQENWEVAYTFDQGLINHIHSIVPDVDGECVWILTGDFGEAAGIWRATKDFSNVVNVVSGHQKYRACVAFPVSDGLLYATDSQLEKNTIRLLTHEDGVWLTSTICDINGSSIYGVELQDYYVFSTATEPDVTDNSKISKLLTNRPGPGIVENKMDIVACRKTDFECRLLYSWDKDIYPFKLFQFGAVMFSCSANSSNILHAYSVGSKRDDLSMSIFDLNEIDWNAK
jgi:hypothetical protein